MLGAQGILQVDAQLAESRAIEAIGVNQKIDIPPRAYPPWRVSRRR